MMVGLASLWLFSLGSELVPADISRPWCCQPPVHIRRAGSLAPLGSVMAFEALPIFPSSWAFGGIPQEASLEGPQPLRMERREEEDGEQDCERRKGRCRPHRENFYLTLAEPLVWLCTQGSGQGWLSWDPGT